MANTPGPAVWLFDVDGVLVRPGGYRAAVRATINHFTRGWGLGDLAPADETLAVFEAQGITIEWDMVPLALAVILDELVGQCLVESTEVGSTGVEPASAIRIDTLAQAAQLPAILRIANHSNPTNPEQTADLGQPELRQPKLSQPELNQPEISQIVFGKPEPSQLEQSQPTPPAQLAAPLISETRCAERFRALGRWVRPGIATSDAVLAAMELAAAGEQPAAIKQPASEQRLASGDHLAFEQPAAQPPEPEKGIATQELQSSTDLIPFPNLVGQGVLRALLSSTRRPAVSPTTSVFQNFVLGDEVYGLAIGLEPLVKSESMLARYDKPLLERAVRDLVLEQVYKGRLHIAAYTARPSAPLAPVSELLAVYTPEAELALALVGLESMALIGSGQMAEAARRMDQPEDRLTKPAPYHALASAAAALTGDRSAALDWMVCVYDHIERGQPSPGLLTAAGPLPEQMILNIFEDSPTGMAGGREAARLFARLGMHVTLRLWGVSSHPEKIAALEGQGARVFADINQAARVAWVEN